VIKTGLFNSNQSWDIPEDIKYNKQTNTEMKIEPYQACYLVQDTDANIHCDLSTILYGIGGNKEDEILLSLHLLSVWIESNFSNEAEYLEQTTCDFLTDVYYKINKEIGYIIFRL
jgi:hypothetical protein